jgi:GNAT superfamily N-acetyltransferase
MMQSWPELNTRVTVRYRRSAGSAPPLSDAVGHLLQIEPTVQVGTKAGAVVEIAPADVVAVRPLTDKPIRTAEIRALEHAAASAHPGSEHCWLDGWFLRAGHSSWLATDSAVPLDRSATVQTIPTIADWYTRRGLRPRLTLPDRLLSVPGEVQRSYQLSVRDLEAVEHHPAVELRTRPADSWLRYGGISVTEAVAVVDGEVIFGSHPGRVTARAVYTDAPDRTRWVGVSGLHLTGADHNFAAVRELVETLLTWGAEHGASRAYLHVPDREQAVGRLARGLGFRLHHRGRCVFAAHS